MSDIAKYERRLAREKTARKEAETLLEAKSAELYDKHLELFALSESLEKLVAQRTAQMQKARDEALTALKIKTDFIANMSHELRTPMNGVLGILGLLQNESLSHEQRELLCVAESSGKHLLEVINDILDFTKIEANKISLDLSPIEVRPFLRGVVAPFTLQAQQKGILLNLAIDDDVEKGLVADKLRLTQIITNLLSNAIKFTHKGEVKLSLHKLGYESYRIAAIDTGIGISQENLKAVFEAFEQADNSITREFGGTGLGMNITKRLVDMMDGKISVESELDKGTCFFVDIKMKSTELEPSKQHDNLSFETSEQQFHLLLVEDHKVNQLVAKKLLESWGFEVSIVENGQQAIDKVKQCKYDAILMDLQMPIMGGINAAKRIREYELISPSVPIIAMTAHSGPEHVKECLDAGMQAHVSKPFDKALLRGVLQEQLSSDIKQTEISIVKPDIHLQHINLDESIERLGGDWSMLYTLIQRFLDEFETFRQEYKAAKRSDNQSVAKAMLHKIKGSGGNLGMTSLSLLAKNAEKLIDEQGQWPSNQAIDEIQDLLEKTSCEFAKVEKPVDYDKSQAKVKVTKSDIVAQISLVQDSLHQDIFAAEDALKVLIKYDLDEELQNLLNQAHVAMQAFDIENVSNALSKVRSMMD